MEIKIFGINIAHHYVRGAGGEFSVCVYVFVPWTVNY